MARLYFDIICTLLSHKCSTLMCVTTCSLQNVPLPHQKAKAVTLYRRIARSLKSNFNKCLYMLCRQRGTPTAFFFRPTPSWLPPGRYTRSNRSKRWIVIIMQGCLLVDSHKSAGSVSALSFVASFTSCLAPLCGSVFLGFASFSVAILIMTHKMSSCMLFS